MAGGDQQGSGGRGFSSQHAVDDVRGLIADSLGIEVDAGERGRAHVAEGFVIGVGDDRDFIGNTQAQSAAGGGQFHAEHVEGAHDGHGFVEGAEPIVDFAVGLDPSWGFEAGRGIDKRIARAPGGGEGLEEPPVLLPGLEGFVKGVVTEVPEAVFKKMSSDHFGGRGAVGDDGGEAGLTGAADIDGRESGGLQESAHALVADGCDDGVGFPLAERSAEAADGLGAGIGLHVVFPAAVEGAVVVDSLDDFPVVVIDDADDEEAFDVLHGADSSKRSLYVGRAQNGSFFARLAH